MIIAVKGTKTSEPEADPSQRYVLKSMEPASRTPVALGAFLMGVAVYLKTIFPNWFRPEEPHPTSEGGSQGGAQPAEFKALAIVPDAGGQANDPAAEESGVGTGKRLLEPQAPLSFMVVDSPLSDFPQPEAPVRWDALRFHPPIANTANDNVVGGGNFAPGSSGPGGTDPGSADPDDADPGNTDTEPDPPDTDPTDTGEDEQECSSDCEGAQSEACEEEDEDPRTENRAPRVSGPVYLMDVTGCAALLIGLADLLHNAHDPDGDMLSVVGLTVSSGALTYSTEGWLYQGDPELPGSVTVTYQITDGELFVDQSAYFSVVRSFVEGTDEDDILLGSVCADDIEGGDGDDHIDARGGGDVIVGGNGDDHIVAGDGNDTVLAGNGHDIVFGGGGNDHISGGNGKDRLFGEAGGDTIFGDGGNDHLSGGEGDDLLSGGDGDDSVQGDAGNDTIDGDDGDDILSGNEGDDLIAGGAGADLIFDGEGQDVVLGGTGDDHVVAARDADDDVYEGGAGHDTLDYSGATESLTIDLVNDIACGNEIGADSVTGFETLVGGEGDDHFVAGDEAVVLAGGAGEDTFEFAAPDEAAPAATVFHEILDFRVGDLIRLSKYDIFEEVLDGLEDRFETIYGDDIDDDDVAIRYRQDRVDEMDRTIIEADFNNDDVYETMIGLMGRHALVIVENV